MAQVRQQDDVVDAEVVETSGGEAQALAVQLDGITRAEIDMQIATAQRYPRSIQRFKERSVAYATFDVETAQGMFYSLKRKGPGGSTTLIQGESIRLAEVALATWGNLRAGVRILGETEDGTMIRALATVHDLETNFAIAVEVTRRITTKDGSKFGADMIAVTGAAASSIALRNATFKVIPKALLRPAYLKAREVAVGKMLSLTDGLQKIVAALKAMSPLITDEKILREIEKEEFAQVTREDIEHLMGLRTALKEGKTVEEVFPDIEPDVPAPEMNAKKASSATAATAPSTAKQDAMPPASQPAAPASTGDKPAEGSGQATSAPQEAPGAPLTPEEKLAKEGECLDEDQMAVIRSAVKESGLKLRQLEDLYGGVQLANIRKPGVPRARLFNQMSADISKLSKTVT